MSDLLDPAMRRSRWQQILLFAGALCSLFFYNEWLSYYVILLQCQWPSLDISSADLSFTDNGATLRVAILSDTHLLGQKEGHWFDKLRREWQMERSFQSSMWIHNPEVIFILGDLFDEGKWCSDSEFQFYVERFHKMFRTSEKQQLYVVVGNHDIGFHYNTDDNKRRRFVNALSAPSVRMLRIKDNIFVLLNSMAFEGDACDMCQDAEAKLKHISNTLNCAQGVKNSNCADKDKFAYSKPIILQHFPMYRVSDSNCTGPDSAPDDVKYKIMNPRWDCLSKDASDKLTKTLNPRLVVSGHTHHFCQTMYNGIPEWTIASFSWRNKKSPSFLLMTVKNNNYAINKCYLPQETTIIYTYVIGVILIVLWFAFPRRLVRASSKRN